MTRQFLRPIRKAGYLGVSGRDRRLRAARTAQRLVHSRQRRPRVRAGVRELPGHRARARRRERHRRDRAVLARVRRRARRPGRHGLAHGGRDRRRDRASGAVPVLVDIDPQTFVLDADRLDARAEQAPVAACARSSSCTCTGARPRSSASARSATRHGALLIEDCAQAHGASVDGKRLGTWGKAAAFSFYPTKNLGALGDGGAVVTNDAGDRRARPQLREYGWRERYSSEICGMNSRLDELQAAILRVKLAHLDADNAHAGASRAAYDAGLAGSHVALPAVARIARLSSVRGAHAAARASSPRTSRRATSARSCTTRSRCTCSRRIAAASRSPKAGCRTPNARRAKCSACRCIRSSKPTACSA